MSKVKTSLFVEEMVWREIKSEAARRGETIGDLVTHIFTEWKGEQDGKNLYKMRRD